MAAPGKAEEVHALYTVKSWNLGHSCGFPLYKALMAAIGMHVGDLLIVRVHPPYVTFRLAHPERIIPIDSFGPEHLPPSWPGKEDNVTTPDDTRRTAPLEPRADTREHGRGQD